MPAGQGLPGEPGAPAEQPAPQSPAPQPRPYPQEPPPTPAPPAPPTPAPAPGKRDAQKDLAQRIADEKAWRQSTEQQIQFLAMQVQASRCNEDDILAGNDDPNLPLVTCSTDHSQVYLLDKSIISGEQIKNANSGLDNQRGEYVVTLEFKPDAANIWADFTASTHRHADRFHAGLSGRQRTSDPGSDPRRQHPDHRAVQRGQGDARLPTC